MLGPATMADETAFEPPIHETGIAVQRDMVDGETDVALSIYRPVEDIRELWPGEGKRA